MLHSEIGWHRDRREGRMTPAHYFSSPKDTKQYSRGKYSYCEKCTSELCDAVSFLLFRSFSHSLYFFVVFFCCLLSFPLATKYSLSLGRSRCVCVCVWISFTRLFDGCCLKLSCLACAPPPLSGFRLLLSHLYLKPSDTLTLLRWHDSVFQQKCSLFFTWLYCMAVCVCVCFSCSKNSIRENNHPNRWRARSFAWVWYVLVCVWRALKNRERERKRTGDRRIKQNVSSFSFIERRERENLFFHINYGLAYP